MSIASLFSLITGMVLFLYGMSVMGDALKRAAGNKLELLLAKLTSTPLKGILLGVGVTALIQSSSATSVMTIGFVNSGMMKLRQAIGIILGAILGTSITGWIIALSGADGATGWAALFSTDTLIGIVALVGLILHSFVKKFSNFGDILLGFAVLMVGIGTMSSAVSPLKDSPTFINMLTKFSNPLLGVIVGALFTAILQSASAAVGILQALAVTGTIDFGTAFPIILGISIGASLPVILSSIGAGIDGKRTAFVYLLISLLGAVICGGVFYAANGIFDFDFVGKVLSATGIALINTLFRFANVIVLCPFIGGIEKLSCLLVSEKEVPGQKEKHEPIVLEERFLQYPLLALSQAERAINDMAEAMQKSVLTAIEITKEYSEEQDVLVKQFEELADRYEDRIGTYLMQIPQNELGKDENASVFKYLHTLSDFERITDYAMQIAIRSRKNEEKGIRYPKETVRELTVLQNAVTEAVDITVSAFTSNKWHTSGKVTALTAVIRTLCHNIELNQVGRVQRGICTMDQNTGVGELLHDLSQIGNHCSKIVLAMAEGHAGSYHLHRSDTDLDVKNSPGMKMLAEYHRKYFISERIM